MEKEELYVTVYGPGWDRCAPVDRVDWSEASIAAYYGGEQVLFVHLASVDAVFVSRSKKQSEK